jgi:hypothetical protein
LLFLFSFRCPHVKKVLCTKAGAFVIATSRFIKGRRSNERIYARGKYLNNLICAASVSPAAGTCKQLMQSKASVD